MAAFDENILTFNVTNTITVVLMLALGYAILAWGMSLYASRNQAQQTLPRAA